MQNEVKKVSLNHIADIYLYEYYVAGDQTYELDTDDTLAEHLKKGHQLMDKADYISALNEWLIALDCNPVCMEAYSGVIACYKYLNDIEEEYKYTLKTYNYCCTRSELAAYYRNLGWYYLEKYQPVVAIACYKYSNLFEKSERAENEVAYLEAALKKSYKDMDTSQMQKIMTENEIPLKANSITLALLYKAGSEALDMGNTKQAYDCFCMVYDLTQDEEIKKMIDACII
ncbi:MAG: hypothetical protein K6B41_10520 [Butyrivibrio sp.]|nr:hypothetical protein [Butyrivibrio sp.]